MTCRSSVDAREALVRVVELQPVTREVGSGPVVLRRDASEKPVAAQQAVRVVGVGERRVEVH
jgi:hypothetical protein